MTSVYVVHIEMHQFTSIVKSGRVCEDGLLNFIDNMCAQIYSFFVASFQPYVYSIYTFLSLFSPCILLSLFLSRSFAFHSLYHQIEEFILANDFRNANHFTLVFTS